MILCYIRQYFFYFFIIKINAVINSGIVTGPHWALDRAPGVAFQGQVGF